MEDGVYVVAWTTPHCVLTLKLIGITWDVYDGAQKVRTIFILIYLLLAGLVQSVSPGLLYVLE